MILLTTEEVIALHDKLVERTGGSHGLRDQSLLESAVYSAMSGFADSEAYPTVEEKAARLMFALTNNHAFVDGHKRIGVLTMLMTVQLNNVRIHYTQAERISLGLSVANGKTEYFEILDWIMEHKISLFWQNSMPRWERSKFCTPIGAFVFSKNIFKFQEYFVRTNRVI